MNNQDVIEKFESIRVYQEQGKSSLHKPILLIYALAQCFHKRERLIKFSEIDREFKNIFLKLNLDGIYENSYYPFGKLENDGIWEVTDSKNLKRTSVGHLFKKELIEKNISGGFVEEIYQALLNNPSLLLIIVNQLLNRYFPATQHQAIRSAIGLPDELAFDKNMVHEFTAEDNNNNYFIGKPQESGMEIQKNDYIAYLNSLHNISANGANALAESQALNPHFGELYEPFLLIEGISKNP